jgi:transposase
MSIRGGKSYTRQFKERAMDLVRVRGLDTAHAARELGIPFTTLGVWLRKAGWVKPVERDVPLPEDPAALKVRVADLERQVKRLEQERDILKKATAYFASQSP